MNFTRLSILILKKPHFIHSPRLRYLKITLLRRILLLSLRCYSKIFIFNHLILCPLEKEQESDDSDTVAVVESSHYSLPAPRR